MYLDKSFQILIFFTIEGNFRYLKEKKNILVSVELKSSSILKREN